MGKLTLAVLLVICVRVFERLLAMLWPAPEPDPAARTATAPTNAQEAAAARLQNALAKVTGCDAHARPHRLGYQVILDQAAGEQLIRFPDAMTPGTELNVPRDTPASDARVTPEMLVADPGKGSRDDHALLSAPQVNHESSGRFLKPGRPERREATTPGTQAHRVRERRALDSGVVRLPQLGQFLRAEVLFARESDRIAEGDDLGVKR